MSVARKTLVAASVLLIGFVAGLVIAGRLSLTTPSVAAPEQAPAPAPRGLPTTAAAGAAASPLPDLSAVAEAALKVSANISSTTLQRVVDPWFGEFVQQSPSLGSGVVVSSDGYVLTNQHVIGNSRADVRVTLPDGRERQARLVGIDGVSDLAVVKIEATGLPTIPWGDSSALRVAEWVLAVGNPFQFTGTVTLGIVSAVSRSGEQVGSMQDFIQTDAAINPGNSGGALVNARGELVGINNRIYAPTGGNQGIGFAIPSNLARRIMTELIEKGAVSWGSIGDIRWVNVDRQTAAENGLDVTGGLVYRLDRRSSAYRAGLEPGDIVTSVNGEPVTGAEQIERAVVRQRIGSTLSLGVRKGDGRRVTIDVPVVARQSPLPR
jgi:S1-C subfamily serine protease